MKKILIIIGMTTFVQTGANAVVCVASGHTTPTFCGNPTTAEALVASNTQSATSVWILGSCGGGTVRRIAGMSYCSATSGTHAQTGNPGSKGPNCWCALTSPALSAWVFLSTESSDNECTRHCAGHCAGTAGAAFTFRSALFSALDN
jgi:hypothetical protein